VHCVSKNHLKQFVATKIISYANANMRKKRTHLLESWTNMKVITGFMSLFPRLIWKTASTLYYLIKHSVQCNFFATNTLFTKFRQSKTISLEFATITPVQSISIGLHAPPRTHTSDPTKALAIICIWFYWYDLSLPTGRSALQIPPQLTYYTFEERLTGDINTDDINKRQNRR